MGQSVRFSSGRNAKFACPRCGLVYPYTQKRYEAYTQTWVCPPCLDELPVDREPIVNVIDAEALRNPRMPAEHEISVARPEGVNMSFWNGDVLATGVLGVLGVEIAMSVGSLTVSGDGAIVPVIGVETVLSVGSVTVSIAAEPTGVEIQFAVGVAVAQGSPAWGQGAWGVNVWGE